GKLTEAKVRTFGDELFDPSLSGLRLKANNTTRWNSVYSIIERASRLKLPLRIFYEEFKDLKPPKVPINKDNILTLSD
ncbi:hypothetical protein QBC39DRAFT_251499, partial [Podospora conica]